MLDDFEEVSIEHKVLYLLANGYDVADIKVALEITEKHLNEILELLSYNGIVQLYTVH